MTGQAFRVGRPSVKWHAGVPFASGSPHACSCCMQVWDYNMINHFKGRVQIPLREVIRQRRLQVRVSVVA